MFVAIGETLFLNHPWPSLKTWASLATIFGGSILYVLTDYQFTLTAYTWAVAYLVSMSIDFVYIKHVVMTIGLNTWGLVLYNNLEALSGCGVACWVVMFVWFGHLVFWVFMSKGDFGNRVYSSGHCE